MSCQAWKCGTYKPAPPVGSEGAATLTAREATVSPPVAGGEAANTHTALLLYHSACLIDVF